MQLSSRILTALAVLILAVAVVAVRAGSPGTVEAATGTIDVLNVGTCYATDTDVFGAGDCDSGEVDEDGDKVDYNVADRDEVAEAGTVYATYAHDPKTAPDSPRAVLENSNLIKISISDSGRDQTYSSVVASWQCTVRGRRLLVPEQIVCSPARTIPERLSSTTSGYLQIIQGAYDAELAIDPDVGATMSWQPRGIHSITTPPSLDITGPGNETGITIIRDSCNGDPVQAHGRSRRFIDLFLGTARSRRRHYCLRPRPFGKPECLSGSRRGRRVRGCRGRRPRRSALVERQQDDPS